jgi:hypothetical protein
MQAYASSPDSTLNPKLIIRCSMVKFYILLSTMHNCISYFLPISNHLSILSCNCSSLYCFSSALMSSSNEWAAICLLYKKVHSKLSLSITSWGMHTPSSSNSNCVSFIYKVLMVPAFSSTVCNLLIVPRHLNTLLRLSDYSLFKTRVFLKRKDAMLSSFLFGSAGRDSSEISEDSTG